MLDRKWILEIVIRWLLDLLAQNIGVVIDWLRWFIG